MGTGQCFVAEHVQYRGLQHGAVPVHEMSRVVVREACIEIARFVKKELGWNVWSFSGYTYEMLKEKGGKMWEFVKELDALIDGPFVLAERDLTLKFRGSRNQRLLHLKNGEITKIE